MTTDNLINLIAAILIGGGTLALALMTWKSIRQTRNMQKSERRERLLNEIIEWATNVVEAAISRRTLSSEELWKAKLSYKFHKAKSKYIFETITSSFKDFSGPLEDINVKLDKLIEVTTEFRIKSMVGGKRLADYEAELTESVEKLLIETAKIKTKDIG